jgi:hypothetical protein
LQLPIGKVLQTPVDAEGHIRAVPRVRDVVHIDGMRLTILHHPLASGGALQRGVEDPLDPLQSAIIHVGEPDHMGEYLAARVEPAILRGQVDADDLLLLHQVLDPPGQLWIDPPLQIEKGLFPPAEELSPQLRGSRSSSRARR